jgi:hypothetical protein
MNLTGAGPIYPVTGRTAAESGSNNNCTDSGCAFGPYLPISNGQTSTCVRNNFSAPVTGTLDATLGSFTGSFPLASSVTLTGNAAQPCPRCVGGDPTIVGSGLCPSIAQWFINTCPVGPCPPNAFVQVASPDAGLPCTPVNLLGDTHDCDPTGLSGLGPLTVDLTPISTTTTSSAGPAGLFCPLANPALQAAAGAFSCNGTTTGNCPEGKRGVATSIEETGVPAGLMGLAAKPVTLASTFCIPESTAVLGFIINDAASLPGPGAVALPGTFQIVP